MRCWFSSTAFDTPSTFWLTPPTCSCTYFFVAQAALLLIGCRCLAQLVEHLFGVVGLADRDATAADHYVGLAVRPFESGAQRIAIALLTQRWRHTRTAVEVTHIGVGQVQ